MRRQWYDERVGSSQQPGAGQFGISESEILAGERRCAYGSDMSISGPNVPSPILGDIGNGRFLRGRRVAKLEHLEATIWVELGRYGTLHDAGIALDAAVASGIAAGTLRVTQVPVKTSMRVLTIVGAVLAVAFVAFFLYVFLAG